MTREDIQERFAFLQAEYAQFDAARRSGDVEAGWRHLERVHIVAQPLFGQHILSHWHMLHFAMKQADGAEAVGQIVRLMLAPFGNLLHRLPAGNTGRARVNAFQPMDFPADLQRFLR